MDVHEVPTGPKHVAYIKKKLCLTYLIVCVLNTTAQRDVLHQVAM